MFESILGEIRKYNRIIIHRHTNPDGDALGSQIGLKYLIEDTFPGKEVYVVGDDAGRFSFIEGSVMDEIDDSMYEGALAIVLDTSVPNLVNDDRFMKATASARIDHHVFCEKFCDVEVTDHSFESCAGMVAYMAKEQGLTLTKRSATALYTGMVTDSGRFRYDSTNARTLATASYLLEQEVDTQEIFMNLYQETVESVKNHAKFVLKMQFSEHNVAYIYNTRKEVEESGLSAFSVSRGMVGCMADLKGVDIWVNFTESDEGVWCEIRSSKFNINPIAVKYGGGGHEKASGATVPDRETAMLMLKDLDNMML